MMGEGEGALQISFLSCFVFIKVVKAGELQSKKCPIEPIVQNFYLKYTKIKKTTNKIYSFVNV